MKKLLLAGPVVIGAVVLGAIWGIVSFGMALAGGGFEHQGILPKILNFPAYITEVIGGSLSGTIWIPLLSILIGAILLAVFILSALGIIAILVTSKKTLIGKR